VNTVNPGARWRIEVVNKPQYDLAKIVARLDSVGEPVLLSLFGTAHDEPYETFRNLWFDGRELPQRLSGLLLAYLYRAEERRLKRGG
jgi:hypothetical protein